MKIPAMLLAVMLPGCGSGTDGVPVPKPMDIGAIVRPASPNTALAAPAGFTPTPDVVTPVYDMPPAALFSAIEAVAAAQPRTYRLATFDDRLQVHFVARSALFGFPDLIMAQVLPHEEGGRLGSTLVLYSRSVYGQSDLGVNRRRVTAWLADLNARRGIARPPS